MRQKHDFGGHRMLRRSIPEDQLLCRHFMAFSHKERVEGCRHALSHWARTSHPIIAFAANGTPELSGRRDEGPGEGLVCVCVCVV